MKKSTPFILFITLFCLCTTALLATNYSFNVSTGNWDVAANWLPNGIPTTGDNVTIPSGRTVTLNIASVTINDLTCSGTLQGANSLNITGNLTINSGALANDGNVSVTGTLTWTGGNIGATTLSTVTDVTIGNLATLSSSPKNLLKKKLVLNSGGNWTAGDINFSTGAILEIPNMQTLTVNNSSFLSFSNGGGAASSIEIKGILLKQGIGTLLSDIPFNNTGTVNITAGILSLNASETSSGTFNVDVTEGLQFNGGTHNLTGPSIMGTGSLRISSIVNLSNNLIRPLRLTGGSLNGTVNTVYTGDMTIESGSFNLDGTVNLTGNLIMNSGKFAPAGATNVSGTLTWTGGDIGATILSTVTDVTISNLATLSSSPKNLLKKKLVLNSGGNWTAGDINFSTGAILEIPNMQVLTVNNSSFLSFGNAGGAASSIEIKGTLLKQGTSTLSGNVAFNNTGTVNITAGVLTLNLGGTSSGTFNVDVTEGLQFNGGTHNLTGPSITGAGSLRISGIVNLSNNLIRPLRLSGGSLNGTANAVYTGDMTIDGGSFNLNGTVNLTGNLIISSGIFAPEGATNISGTLLWTGGIIGATTLSTVTDVTIGNLATLSLSTKYLLKKKLILNGGGNWTAGDINMGSGAILETAALQTLIFNSANGVTSFGNAGGAFSSVDIKGTLLKQGTGTLVSNIYFNNTGVINITSGILSLNGGSTSTGTFIVNSNDGLQFIGTTHTLNGAMISGAGSMLIYATNLNAVGAYTSTISKTTIPSGGTFNGDGTMNLTGNLVISGGTFAPVGAAAVGGTLSWTSGTIGVTTSSSVTDVTINGAATFSNSVKNLNKRRLILNAGGSWTGGDISLSTSAVLEIAASQTLTFNSANGGTLLNNVSGTNAINIIGNFVKQGTGTLICNVFFNNTGTVNVTSGILTLNTGGTNTGAFNIESNDGLQFTGGTTHTLNGATINGAGSMVTSATNLNAVGTYTSNISKTTISSGTFNGDATMNLTGNLVISGGTFAPVGAAAIGGTLSWTSGTIGVTTSPSVTDVTINGAATFSNSLKTLNKRRLILNAGGSWTGGDITIANSGIFELTAGQSLIVNMPGSLILGNGSGTGNTVEIKGTLSKQGAGLLISNTLFNNTGIINIDAGTLAFNTAYSGEGSMSVASGAILNIGISTGLNYLNPIFSHNGSVTGSFPIVFKANIAQLLSGNGTTINNLAIDNTNNLTILGTQIIGNLTFTNGKILLQNGDLDLSGNIINATSSKFIVTQGAGRLLLSISTLDKVFPIGPDVSSYNPVTLRQATTSAKFGARVKIGLENDKPLNKIGYVNRQWTVDNISGIPNATLGLSWQSPSHETGTFSPSDNRFYRWNGTTWASASANGTATLSAGFYNRTLGGVTQFSPYVVSSCIPVAPSVSNVVYCQNDIATALTVVGSNLLWYSTLIGGTGSTIAPTPSTATAGTTSYFVTQTEDCESPRAEIQVLIKPLPTAPSVSNVAFCQNEVSSPLTATGSNLLWYAASTGGSGSTTAPIPSTENVGTTSYFVSQTVDACEGPRAKIQVTINPTPLSPSVSNVVYCQNDINSALTATGSNLLWYNTLTGGTGSTTAPTPLTISAGTTSFFVSQTVNNCESPRAEIQVLVNPTPATPSVSNVVYCQNDVAAALTATGSNLLWYTAAIGGIGSTTAPIPSTTTASTTSYFVTQTLLNCESPRAEIQVLINALPVVSITGLNTSYCKDATAVTLTGTPNDGSFTIDAVAATTFDPALLTVGNHIVVYNFTDANGCFNSANQTFTVHALPAVSITGLNTSYCKDATAVTLTGTPNNSSFTIDAVVATSFDPSQLTIGNHTVVLSFTDGNGCSNSANQIVTVNALPVVSILNLNANYCKDAAVVTLSGSPTGGGFTIDGNAAITFDASQLTVGNHVVVYSFTDENGCFNSTNQTVKVNALPTVSMSNLNASYCQNAAAITLTGTPAGGTFTIDGYESTMFDPSVLTIGNHTVLFSFTDGNSCSNAVSQMISVIASPQYTTTATPILCFGQKSTVTITPTNGLVNQFKYSINGGTTLKTTNIFTNVAVGTYMIYVLNIATNCSTQENITITQPNVLAATVTKTNISCNDVNDGQISVVPTGGTSPYQINFNSAGFQSNMVFQNLVAGTYNLIVKDANGCTLAKNSNVITNPAVISLAVSSTTDILCNGAVTGKIIVAATGGTGTKQYSKNGGTTWQTSSTFSNLAVGAYEIISKDANGCLSNIVSATLTQPDALTGSIAKTNLTCNASADGTITITASGGISPYSFSINNGSNYGSSNSFTGLVATTYNVRVKDANNCVTANQAIAVTQPTVPTFTTTQTNITCNGLTNGSITFTTTTGGNGGAYQYSIDNGATWQTNTVFTGLAVGTYNAKIQDVNGCLSITKVVTLTQPTVVSLAIMTITNIFCNGAATGKIIALATGGTSTKQYSKNGGTTWQTSSTFSALTAGTYQIVSKDANGCLSNIEAVELTQPTSLSFTYTKVNLSCNASADGSITIVEAGGVAPYSYTINNGTTYFPTNSFTNLTAATYTGRVKDANGCATAAQSVAVTQPTVVNATTAVVNVTCNGNTDGKITISNPTGGNGAPYQYTHSNGAAYQTNPVFTGLTSGIYYVKIIDVNGCLSATKVLTVTEPAPMVYTINKQDITCLASGTIAVTMSGGGTAPYKYSKNGGLAFQTSNTFLNVPVGVYPVQVKDNKNCLSAIQEVEIFNLCIAASVSSQTSSNSKVPNNKGNNLNDANSDALFIPNQKGNDKNSIDFIVYPNPAQNEAWLNLKSVEGLDVNILVLDMTGKVVQRKSIQQVTPVPYRLDMADMPTGLYLIKLQTEGKQPVIRKLQVTKD